MSEQEILDRLEHLEQQYKQLHEAIEQLQRQLGRQYSADTINEETGDRPWIEG